MEFLIALGTFLTIFLVVYGAGYKSANGDPMDARLGGLRYTRSNREPLPDTEGGFVTRIARPMAKNLARKINGLLPSTMSARLEETITQAGLRIQPGQFILAIGILAGVLPILTVIYMGSMGMSMMMIVVGFFVALGAAVYLPRIWLMGRVKRRRKAIWKALPDAFDLITASVEAGLGIDAAFTRVVEKVKGPFAAELSRSMREITMGRARRDAFQDMAARTGVEELRSLINAIVQAETMGISIGSVIRVQTGVMRVKRKQRAEQQAFKAPVKMVFPLVLCIFPCIMVIIGGPAILQVMDTL